MARITRGGTGAVGAGAQSLISSRSQLAKAAQLYYLEEISQQQIAKRLNVSVASVSRALSKARQLGIVEITIHTEEDDFSRLEIELAQLCGLRECLIVPSFEQLDHTYSEMARALSELLGRILEKGDTLGLSWGETLKAVSEKMPPVAVRDVDVVPITGSLGRIDTGIYPSSLARAFAEKVRGTPYLLNTPAIVGSKLIRRSLQSDTNFQQIREMWSRLNVVLIGVSGVDEDSSMFRGGIFGSADLASLRAAGGVCACNFSLFDATGEPVHAEVSDRLVKLPLADLRQVDRTVLIAGGPKKVNPLRAILRSRVVNTLITDVDCAQAILENRDGTAPAQAGRERSPPRKR